MSREVDWTYLYARVTSVACGHHRRTLSVYRSRSTRIGLSPWAFYRQLFYPAIREASVFIIPGF